MTTMQIQIIKNSRNGTKNTNRFVIVVAVAAFASFFVSFCDYVKIFVILLICI